MVLKTLGLVVCGVAAGLALATLVHRNPDWGAHAGDSPIPIEASSNASRDDVVALRTDMDRRLATIEGRLTALASEVEALRQNAAPTQGAAVPELPTPEEFLRRDEELRQRFDAIREARRIDQAQRETEQLLAAGFSPERIEWIRRRSEELRMERTQANYERRLAGQPPDPDELLWMIDSDVFLRSEMGDDEYERYLEALGQPTAVMGKANKRAVVVGAIGAVTSTPSGEWPPSR